MTADIGSSMTCWVCAEGEAHCPQPEICWPDGDRSLRDESAGMSSAGASSTDEASERAHVDNSITERGVAPATGQHLAWLVGRGIISRRTAMEMTEAFPVIDRLERGPNRG